MDLTPEKLDEAHVALESLTDDLRETIRDGRGLHPMESAVAARRWNNLAAQYGFESFAATASSVWDVVKRASVVSATAFGKFVESVQVYLDKSGGKEVDRMRRLLEDTQGEGSGVITDEKLATALAINGRVPSEFRTATQQLVGLVKLLEKAVPAIAQVGSSAQAVVKKETGALTTELYEKIVETLVKMVNSHPSPTTHFPSALVGEQFIGGRLFLVEQQYKLTKKAPAGDKAAAKLQELVEGVKSTTHGTRATQKAINPRLAVLDREGVHALIDECETLTDALHRLLHLGKEHSSPGAPQVVEYFDQANKLFHAKSVASPSGAVRARASLLESYFSRSINDERELLRAALAIVSNAHKAYSAYIHASLKHFK